MNTWPDPYGVLGVSPDASIDEIRLAYRHRMRALHLDRGGADDVVAHGEMAAVTEAWRRLSSDPAARSHRDLSKRRWTGTKPVSTRLARLPAAMTDPLRGCCDRYWRSRFCCCWRGWRSPS